MIAYQVVHLLYVTRVLHLRHVRQFSVDAFFDQFVDHSFHRFVVQFLSINIISTMSILILYVFSVL